jgi:hypothetical protein
LGAYALDHPNESLDQFLGQEMTFGENPPFKFTIDQDRLDRVQVYVDNVNREPGRMWVEQKLETTPIFGVPDQQGHADVVKLDPHGVVLINEREHKGVLSVHDFKDGYLKVGAKNNLQGMNYLAAALYKFDLIADIEALRFVIHQPKIGNFDEWTYTRAEIEAFVTVIRPVAQLVYDIYHGVVEFDPAKHLQAGEQQCFWCPVRGRCPARARHIISMFEPLINRHELDDAMFGLIYTKLDDIAQAVKDYHNEAYRRALMGLKVPGQKLVRGYEGDRTWADKQAAEAALSTAIPDEKLFTKKLISPAQAEKIFKEMKNKTALKSLSNLIYRAPGSPTLAPVDDKRPEIALKQFGLTAEEAGATAA